MSSKIIGKLKDILFFRFNLTQLEEWCRTNQLHENFNVVEQLEPITEVVQLLQVNKKSIEDVDGIISIISKLNTLQVRNYAKILKNLIIVKLLLNWQDMLKFKVIDMNVTPNTKEGSPLILTLNKPSKLFIALNMYLPDVNGQIFTLFRFLFLWTSSILYRQL